MSRLLDTPQVVMTPSRGHGANLSSRDGMVPQDLLSVVSRRGGLVATMIAASLLGAFAVSGLLLPKAYESTATLLPQLDSKEGGSLAALLATTGAGGMAQNLGMGLPSMPTTPTDVFVAILKSRVMADEAIAKFGLMAVYNERTMHDTRVELAERVRVSVSKEKVIKVTVEDADPQRAADIAAFFVSSLDRLNRTLNVSKASYNRAFIERRLAETQTGLVKTEEALRDFQRNNKAVAVEAQSKAMIEAWSARLASGPPPFPRNATTGTCLARAASAARSRLGLAPLVLWSTSRSPGRQCASTCREKTWSKPRSLPAASRSEVSVVRATAARARRFLAYRTTNSVARCCASAALPPLPAK